MYEHLHAPVLTQVKGCVLVYALSFTARQIAESHRQCLLVGFCKLWLCGILVAANAWRQHVVYRCLVVIFLYVDSCCGYSSASCHRVVKCLLVYSPLTSDEVEAAETHHDRACEAGEKHTHETYAREVVYRAYLLLVFPERYAELVPCGCTLFAVSQRSRVDTFVDDVILPHHHVLRAYAHVVLEIFLILVERIVLIDILNVGSGLV